MFTTLGCRESDCKPISFVSSASSEMGAIFRATSSPVRLSTALYTTPDAPAPSFFMFL